MRFIWYDYETFSLSLSHARIAQFAAIITDQDFCALEEPIVLSGKLPDDIIPQPAASLVTGITPQAAKAQGLSEAELSKRIHTLFNQPATCIAGYNNIRFDDEITRFLFYRNLYDSYTHEYQNQSSRWDLLDTLRFIQVMAPETLIWPKNERGHISFKLEDMSAANHLSSHHQAHNALSDVQATMELARIVKKKQPRWFDYAFQLRTKQQVKRLLAEQQDQALLHVSGRLPANQGHADLVYPLAQDVHNPNKIYVVSLHSDIAWLLQAEISTLKEALFHKKNATTAAIHDNRLRIKGVRLNRSPVLAPAAWLSAQRAKELHIDKQQCQHQLHHILQLHAEQKKALADKITQLFTMPQDCRTDPHQDVEQQLYTGSFFSAHDKKCLQHIHQIPPAQLGIQDFAFQDIRLPELLWRYRARNFYQTLTSEERKRWEEEKRFRLSNHNIYNLDQFCHDWAELYVQHKHHPKNMKILHAVKDYVQHIAT